MNSFVLWFDLMEFMAIHTLPTDFAYHCAFLFHVNRLDKPINMEIVSTLTKLIIQQVIGISEHPSLTYVEQDETH